MEKHWTDYLGFDGFCIDVDQEVKSHGSAEVNIFYIMHGTNSSGRCDVTYNYQMQGRHFEEQAHFDSEREARKEALSIAVKNLVTSPKLREYGHVPKENGGQRQTLLTIFDKKRVNLL